MSAVDCYNCWREATTECAEVSVCNRENVAACALANGAHMFMIKVL